jgi:hypothetical protein
MTATAKFQMGPVAREVTSKADAEIDLEEQF